MIVDIGIGFILKQSDLLGNILDFTVKVFRLTDNLGTLIKQFTFQFVVIFQQLGVFFEVFGKVLLGTSVLEIELSGKIIITAQIITHAGQIAFGVADLV